MNCFDKLFSRVFHLLFLLSMVSCHEAVDGNGKSDEETEVTFLVEYSDGLTKSSLSPDEGGLSDLMIMAYCDGELEAYGYYESFEGLTMELDSDKIYDLYALANVGLMEPPGSAGELKEMKYSIAEISELDSDFPMSWTMTVFSPSLSSQVTICLVRLVSKVTLTVDCGDTGLEVSSVRLRQAPLSVRPFEENGSCARQNEVAEGDYASGDDLEILNAGGRICFYMFENMQGTLLPDNTDYMQKVLDNRPDREDVCTYLEVNCVFTSGSKEGGVDYRLYLGKDNITNFDVERNRVISVSLELTEDGFGIKDSWKIVSDYIQHAEKVAVNPNVIKIFVGEKMQLTASVSPDDACDKTVTWVSGNSSIASVDQNGTVTGMALGICSIRAYSNDRTGLFATCAVMVSKPKLVALSFSPSSVKALLDKDGTPEKSYFTVVGEYSDGTYADVTSSCSFSSDLPSSACVEEPGVVQHLSEGTAVITAELDGIIAEMTAVTEGYAMTGVELNVSEVAVALGDTFTIRFRVLFNDGTFTNWISYGLFSNEGISADGWVMSNSSVANVNTYGVISPVKEGSTAVRITLYDQKGRNFTASAKVNVKAATLMRIYVKMPSVFYDYSPGPSLMGVYSDGTESVLRADSWTTDHQYVTYSDAAGLRVLDDDVMQSGITRCTFTAAYGGMTASAVSLYAKCIRGIKIEKTVLDGHQETLYRLLIQNNDFTEEYVSFRYWKSRDGRVWDTVMTSPASGVAIDYSWPYIRFETYSQYYDSTGSLRYWSAEL